MFVGVRAAILAVFLLSMVCLPLILSGNMRGRGASDHLRFHEPAIQRFSDQWPNFDFKDYASATTPGYHVLLATAEHAGADSRTQQRLIGFSFGAVLVGMIAAWCGHRTQSVYRCLLVVVPLCLSFYIINSSAWLLPDNLGWLGVFTTILIALRSRFGVFSLLLGSVTLIALVFTRQIHIWAATPLWVAAWISASGEPDDPSPLPPLNDPIRRVASLGLAMVLSIPAFWTLFAFYRLWGGHLTPPKFVEMHASGLNPSSLIMTLSLFGIVGVCNWFEVAPGVLAAWKRTRVGVAIVVASAFALSLLPHSSYGREELGRWSGIWDLAKWSYFDRSPIMVALSVLGVMSIFGWCVRVPARVRWVMLGSIIAFSVTQMFNAMAWQRYHEPFVLIVAALLGASIPRDRMKIDDAPPLLRAVGPIVLTLMLLGVTCLKLVTERPATLKDNDGVPGFGDTGVSEPDQP